MFLHFVDVYYGCEYQIHCHVYNEIEGARGLCLFCFNLDVEKI